MVGLAESGKPRVVQSGVANGELTDWSSAQEDFKESLIIR